MAFVPPSVESQLRAVGSLEQLPDDLRRAFTPAEHFEGLTSTGRSDWVNVARERGQTFQQFARSHTSHPTHVGGCLYLQPFGSFTGEAAELLPVLERFAAAYFMREVRLLPSVALADLDLTTRRNRFTDVLQLNTRDILRLLGDRMPADACALLAVTAEDLYPHDTWSFVIGEAVTDDRVGVFSLARCDPRFYDKPVHDPTLMLRRACKVLAHEACHIFGLRHCVFFRCVMNGTNHLLEGDLRPLHACPIDLRKLHWALGFDIVERFRRLAALWADLGVVDEVRWIRRRLEFICAAAESVSIPVDRAAQ